MAAKRVRSTALGYALLAPSLFGVVTFLLLPMLVVFWLSLHRWDLLGPIRYVGLNNWQSVLTDRSFATSLVVTLAFIAMVVPAQTVLGLIAATMLARGLPGTGFFRTLYVLPWICAPLAIAVLWRWILAPTDGAVSTLLGHQIEWLTDPGLALPVVSAVVVWTNVGYVTLFFLAGILNIPEDIHNAARTDGATAWQRFRRITLPMLRPTLFLVTVTGIISAAQVFDTVYALTAGGPLRRTDLVSHRIYAEAFGAAAVGRAAVMAAVLFVLPPPDLHRHGTTPDPCTHTPEARRPGDAASRQACPLPCTPHSRVPYLRGHPCPCLYTQPLLGHAVPYASAACKHAA